MLLKWYAIHVFSGHEKKIKKVLESEIERNQMQDQITRILIPAEDVVEMRDGKKRVKNRIFFPGYMLVEMELNKKTQHLVLDTNGVTNFVGPKNQPVPLHEDEVRRILGRVEDRRDEEVIDIPFREGDPVKVIDGPFSDFSGIVEDVNREKKKLKVMVSIFGRSTPVELDFLQISLEK
ncbi:MAG TPA: transcription termination/antitermination factor NusG [bacterium]|nr:transcription termination/antitermination factor NusG [bacterium]